MNPEIPTPVKTKRKISTKNKIVMVAFGILGFCIICSGIAYVLNVLGAVTSPTSTLEQTQALIVTTEVSKLIPIETQIPTTSNTPESTTTKTVIPIPTETEIPASTKTEIPVPSTSLLPAGIDECIPRDTLIQKGIVSKIVDGDTIDIRLEDGITNRVRYIGIDTPERERPLYDEAAQANSQLILNKEILLIRDVSEVDDFDRLLRYIVVDNIFVNQELVGLGLAVAESYPPDTACDSALLAAQQEAQSNNIGLWVPTQTPEPSAPKVVIVSVNKQAEYVDIKNTGTFDVDLSGWVLVSEKGNQSCPLSGILKVSETLRIWALSSPDGGYSCGFGSNIWNNSESDPAVLYNPQGVEVSRK